MIVLVGFGQCVARDGLAAKAQMIEMLALHAHIDLDVVYIIADGQLSKRQSQELIEAREVFDFVLSAPVKVHPAECLQGQVSYDLRKDELTRTHACPQQMRSAEHVLSPEYDSNRGKGKSQIYFNKSWGYVKSDGKRWGTCDASSLFNTGINLKL